MGTLLTVPERMTFFFKGWKVQVRSPQEGHGAIYHIIFLLPLSPATHTLQPIQHVHGVEKFSGKRKLAKLPDSAAPEIKDKQTPNKLEKKRKFNVKNNF